MSQPANMCSTFSCVNALNVKEIIICTDSSLPECDAISTGKQWCFREAYCFRAPRLSNQKEAAPLTAEIVKMEAPGSSKTSVNIYCLTWHHIPHLNFHKHCSENLKSELFAVFISLLETFRWFKFEWCRN